MSIFIIFAIGLMIGSFLNVCIYRLPKDESIVAPRSYCPNCKKAIAWYDNVPVLSYLVLMGKCRFCKARISPRYPIVEILTASLVTLLFISFGASAKFLADSIMVSGLIVAAFIDFEHQVIPDHVTIGGLILAPVLAFIFPSIMGEVSRLHGLFDSILGAVVGAAMIFLIGLLGKALFKKEAMGEGDIWLLAMIGAFLGWKMTILTFFVAPISGAIVGIFLKLKDGREIIPYGPHLSFAAVVVVLWGEKILRLMVGRGY